jgi:hypothetical protein
LNTITMDEWEETFNPISNYLDTNASFQNENGVGIMFETYGEELELIQRTKEQHVWTYIDSEITDGTVIIAGYHVANRIGYFITAREWGYTPPVTVLVSEGN